MSLLSITTKRRIKRAAKPFGLLRFANQLEYWWGNRITSDRLIFYRRFITKESLCFDIGAHFGLKTKLFRRLGARVISVEPIADCCLKLRTLYATDQHTTIVEAACGERSGTAILRYRSLDPQTSTITTDTHSIEADQYDRNVSLTTLDRLIEIYGVPNFCKIDCEGYEDKVLRGLSSCIPAISFEFHSSDFRGIEFCTDRLNQIENYRFNFVRSNAHRFVAPHWLTRAELLDQLGNEQPETAGDIFAVSDQGSACPI
jgi:FkbM family methyltransferase